MTAADNITTLPLDERDESMPALIPEGQYRLKLEHWRTCNKWGRQAKVDVVLSVIDGRYAGTRLTRHYNALRIIGKPMRSGKFAASFHGDLMREFVTVTGKRPPRLDRIPLSEMGRHILIGEVRTVKTYRRAERGQAPADRPDLLQYSIVAQILKREVL